MRWLLSLEPVYSFLAQHLRLAPGRRIPLRERALDPVPPGTTVPPVGDGHVLRPANGDGGDQSLPELLDRLQVADEHPVGPIREGHELLGQPPDIFFDGEAAARALTRPLPETTEPPGLQSTGRTKPEPGRRLTLIEQFIHHRVPGAKREFIAPLGVFGIGSRLPLVHNPNRAQIECSATQVHPLQKSRSKGREVGPSSALAHVSGVAD